MRTFGWAVAALAFCGVVTAQDDGFVPLFNGKDLTGWVYPKKDGPAVSGASTPDGRVTVENGAIVMKPKDNAGKGGIKDLYTEKAYEKDLTLRLQFRAAAKADSGVYIRGPQLQIRDFVRRGEQKQLTKFKNDDWNDLEIVVTGTEATFTVNGEPLAPAKMKVPAKGPIGLQAEAGQFEFRNVRIREAK